MAGKSAREMRSRRLPFTRTCLHLSLVFFLKQQLQLVQAGRGFLTIAAQRREIPDLRMSTQNYRQEDTSLGFHPCQPYRSDRTVGQLRQANSSRF